MPMHYYDPFCWSTYFRYVDASAIGIHNMSQDYVRVLFNRIGWDYQFAVPDFSVATSLTAGWSLSSCRWSDLCRYRWMRHEINGGTGSCGRLLSPWEVLSMSKGARILFHVEIYCYISYWYNCNIHIFVFYFSNFYLPHVPFYSAKYMF